MEAFSAGFWAWIKISNFRAASFIEFASFFHLYLTDSWALQCFKVRLEAITIIFS